MHDSLIPIILAIVAAIIGAITQGKKKTFSPPEPPMEEPDFPHQPLPREPEAEVILKKILGEFMPETVAPPAPASTPAPAPVTASVSQEKPQNTDLEVPDELKRQRELLMAVEGISSLEPPEVFVHDEIHDDIANTQIRDAEEDHDGKPFFIEGVGHWDTRKAVIFSEILNRKAAF